METIAITAKVTLNNQPLVMTATTKINRILSIVRILMEIFMVQTRRATRV